MCVRTGVPCPVINGFGRGLDVTFDRDVRAQWSAHQLIRGSYSRSNWLREIGNRARGLVVVQSVVWPVLFGALAPGFGRTEAKLMGEKLLSPWGFIFKQITC